MIFKSNIKNLSPYILAALVYYFSAGQAYSQFTITADYKPVPGDSTAARYADTTGIEHGEPGANQVWNFSNLTVNGVTFIEYFVTPSSTPYYGLFPNSNLASIQIFSGLSSHHYFRVSDTAFLQLGWIDPPVTAIFGNPFVRNHYPVYFGSQYISSYNFIITSGNRTEHIWGSKTETCDGFGTIILPSGTYNNTLRIKTTDDEADTIKTGGVVTNIYHNLTTNYFWCVQGYKFPVFVISYAFYQNTYNKNVSYCLTNEPVGIKQVSASIPNNFCLFQNFPNPFNPSTKIKFQVNEPGHVNLKVFDIMGKEVAELVNEKLQPGEYEVPFNAGLKDNYNLSSGIYYYTLETEKYKETKKMILLK
jgi:hypothetical protein